MKLANILILVAMLTGLLSGQSSNPNSLLSAQDTEISAAKLTENKKEEYLKDLRDQISLVEQDIERFSKNVVDPSKAIPEIDSEFLRNKLGAQNLSLADIKTHLSTVDTHISVINSLLSGAKSIREGDKQRLKTIPEDKVNTKQALSTLAANETSQSAFDQKILEAEIELSGKQITKLEKEEDFLTKRVSKNDQFIEQLNIRLAEIGALQKLWQERFASSESEQLKRLLTEFSNFRKENVSPSAFRDQLDEAILLTEDLLKPEGLNYELSQVKSTYKSLEKSAKTLAEQGVYAQNRLKLLQEAELPIDLDTGRVLRKQRASLPSTKSLSEALRDSNIASTSNDLTILELENIANDLPEDIKEFRALFGPINFSEKLPETALENILSGMVKVYDITISKRQALRESQAKLQTLQRTTIKKARHYSKFLNEKLMWIASHDTLNAEALKEEGKEFAKLLAPDFLRTWLEGVISNLKKSPYIWGLIFVALFAALICKRKLEKLVNTQHAKAQGNYVVSSKHMYLGFIIEIIIVAPLPLVLFSLAVISNSIAELYLGLSTASVVLFIASLVKNLSREDGFINANFSFNQCQVAILHRCSKLVRNFGVPLMLFTEMLTYSETLTKDGRLATIITLLFISFVLFIALRPQKGIINIKEGSILPYIFCIIFVSFPVILAVASAIGYHHSVLLLKPQFIYTIRTVLVILFLMFFARRLLLISRRKLAIASMKDDPKEDAENSENSLTRQEKLRLKLDNISEINQQTAKLINVGAIAAVMISLWIIWSNSLPALRVLDDIKAWGPSTPIEQVESTVTEGASSGDPLASSGLLPLGSQQLESTKASQPKSFVSIQDILIALGVALLTYLTAVNLPGLTELLILNRLRLSEGTGFAIKTAISYVIVIIGVFWTFNAIGISWGKVQWLAAAVSLGIGFGLQEIFANFVAGIILLFEKPIRIGDLVTVGSLNGKVTKIKIRATTILQFNNRELIVPNKEFITGQLQNWTLSDSIMRAEISVGIAYGSDTRKAEELLQKVAKENRRVLTEPAPQVLFSAFGASSLDFILRIFISSAEDLLPSQSEIHFAIDDEFRKAGIEIAFPQQDIHIRTIDNPIPIYDNRK